MALIDAHPAASRRGSLDDELDDAAAAVIVAALFTVVYVVLFVVAPPRLPQMVAADPLVQALLAFAGAGAIPIVVAVVAATWWIGRPPTRPAIARACRSASFALAFVAGALPLARLVNGPLLPTFVPPEEGSAPGVLLSVGAGLVEEVIFRLSVLPAALVVGARVVSMRLASATAVLVTGLTFALAHEFGAGAGEFSAAYFLARFLFPGCIMSAVALRVGFSFMVAAHCGAHLLLPVLFR